MTERVVVLVDMDCFYVQVEEREQPHLKGKPAAVVQYNPWRGGGIIAVNYEARAFGVKRGMRGDQAREKCPDIQLVQVPVSRGKADLTKYRDAGKEVIDVLVEFSDCVERASIDEAYVDLTSVVETRAGQERVSTAALPSTWVVGYSGEDQLEWDGTEREAGVTRWLARPNEDDMLPLEEEEEEEEEDEVMRKIRKGRVGTKGDLRLALAAAHCEEMRRAIFTRTKFKCSAGIAHNKMLAKLACGIHKPNQQTVLPQGEVADLWEGMPVGKVRNLGGKLGDFLKENLGCVTMAHLSRVPLTTLLTHYDLKTGLWLRDLGLGIDNEPVTSRQLPKSIGCGKNFQGRETLNTVTKVRQWTRSLADELSERLTADKTANQRTARTLTVGVRLDKDDRWYSLTRSCHLPSYDPERITRVSLSLFQHKNTAMSPDVWSPAIKHISLSASKFEDIGGSGLANIADMFKKAERKAALTPIPSTAPNVPRKPLDDSVNSLNVPEDSPSTSTGSGIPSTAPNVRKMALNGSKRSQNLLSFFSSTPASPDLSATAPNVLQTSPDIFTSRDVSSSAQNGPKSCSNVPETLPNTPASSNIPSSASNAPRNPSNVPETLPNTPASSNIPSSASNAPRNPSNVPAESLNVPETLPNIPDTSPSTSSTFLSPQTPSTSSSLRKSFFKSYLSKTSISPPSPSSSCSSSSSSSQPPSEEEEEEDNMEDFSSQSLTNQSPVPICHQAKELTNRIAAKVREGRVSFPSQVSHEERSAEVRKGQSNSFFKNFLLNRLKNDGGDGGGSGDDLRVVKCGENEGRRRDSEEEDIVVLGGEGREERERKRDRNSDDERKINRSERNNGEEKENMKNNGDNGDRNKDNGDLDLSLIVLDGDEGNGREKDNRNEKCEKGRGIKDKYETEEEFDEGRREGGTERLKEGRREINKQEDIEKIHDKEGDGDNREERLNERKRGKTDKFEEIERRHDKNNPEKHDKETEEGDNEGNIIEIEEEEEENEGKRRKTDKLEEIKRKEKHIRKTKGNNEGKTIIEEKEEENEGKRRKINKLKEIERKLANKRLDKHNEETEEGENEENTREMGGKEEEKEEIYIDRENSLSPELFSSWEVEKAKEKMRNRATKRKKRVRFADSATETTSVTEGATEIEKEVHSATRGKQGQNSATSQSQVKTSASTSATEKKIGLQVNTSSWEDIQSATGETQAHTSITSMPGTPQAGSSASNTTRALYNTTTRDIRENMSHNTTNTTQNSATSQPGTPQASHSANNTTRRELEGKTSHNTTNTTTSTTNCAESNPGTSNDSARDRILALELFPDLDNVDTSLLPLLPQNLRAEVEALIARHSGTSKRHSTPPEDSELTGIMKYMKRSPKKVPGEVRSSLKESACANLNYSARNFELSGGLLVQCPECQACMSPFDFHEHQDYHVALKLQNDLQESGQARSRQVTRTKGKKRGRPSAKDLAGMKTQKLDAFFNR